ncbi:hypothetical protein RV13_GL002970 [Enterococcus raffinosus]|nr:hypothetical protein RV13_GL002970 [Enterococcus raffinosus]
MLTLYQTNGHKSRKPTKHFKPFDIFLTKKKLFYLPASFDN